jgi:predicted ABC-type ATPase
MQAQAIADRRRAACIAERRSFSFETVMSHPSKVEVLHQARDAGFRVKLFFVGIDNPLTNIERVALRVAQGGHDVPADRIVPRWHRSMALLYDAIRASAEAYIFDNSAAGIIESGPRLVFVWRYVRELSMATHREFPPIPGWVQRYVLEPLRKAKWRPE